MLIAICGHPRSGKTEVQRLLQKLYGVEPIDDGWPLRDYAMRHMGASHFDVCTEPGKRSLAYMSGEPVVDARTGEHLTWRRVLGLIGMQFEELFGGNHLPRCALLRVKSKPGAVYSFASVRRDQPLFYKQHGALVVEVSRPDVGPTGNDFDVWNGSVTDFVINNDGSLADLKGRVSQAFDPYLGAPLDVVA